jgi:hypothetical protein
MLNTNCHVIPDREYCCIHFLRQPGQDLKDFMNILDTGIPVDILVYMPIEFPSLETSISGILERCEEKSYNAHLVLFGLT